MTAERPIRIGAVSYLNTKPLVYGLEQLAPQAELLLDVPSRLAEQLAAGQLDVALIPSIEFFQDPTYTIVSDACIGCRGPVLSVKLFSRVAPHEIRTLALDEGSRTSVALIRILLKERFDLEPQLVPLPIGAMPDDVSADAMLLIGDRAMRSPGGPFRRSLGPGRRVVSLGRITVRVRHVDGSCRYRPGRHRSGAGRSPRSRLAALARNRRQGSRSAGLSRPECVGYLRDNLHFSLGQAEMRGLEMFYRLALKMNLAPAGVELGISDCQSAG